LSIEDCGRLFNHGIQFELPIGCNAEPIPIVITDARSAEMMRYAANAKGHMASAYPSFPAPAREGATPISVSARIRLVWPYQKDWGRGSMQHLIGNTTILPPANSREPVCRHDDQVEKVFLCVVNDLISWLAH